MYNFIILLYSLAGERTVTVGECSSGDIAIFLILSRKYENWCYNFCWLLNSTILCKRKSDYNILRTGKVQLFSSGMGAMHGDMAKNAYPVAIIQIQNKYS